LEAYAAVDPCFAVLGQRCGFRDYLKGLLLRRYGLSKRETLGALFEQALSPATALRWGRKDALERGPELSWDTVTLEAQKEGKKR
jgi:hypothetical protein